MICWSCAAPRRVAMRMIWSIAANSTATSSAERPSAPRRIPSTTKRARGPAVAMWRRMGLDCHSSGIARASASPTRRTTFAVTGICAVLTSREHAERGEEIGHHPGERGRISRGAPDRVGRVRQWPVDRRPRGPSERRPEDGGTFSTGTSSPEPRRPGRGSAGRVGPGGAVGARPGLLAVRPDGDRCPRASREPPRARRRRSHGARRRGPSLRRRPRASTSRRARSATSGRASRARSRMTSCPSRQRSCASRRREGPHPSRIDLRPRTSLAVTAPR